MTAAELAGVIEAERARKDHLPALLLAEAARILHTALLEARARTGRVRLVSRIGLSFAIRALEVYMARHGEAGEWQ